MYNFEQAVGIALAEEAATNESRNVNVVDKAVIQSKIVGIKLPSVSVVERGDTLSPNVEPLPSFHRIKSIRNFIV